MSRHSGSLARNTFKKLNNNSFGEKVVVEVVQIYYLEINKKNLFLRLLSRRPPTSHETRNLLIFSFHVFTQKNKKKEFWSWKHGRAFRSGLYSVYRWHWIPHPVWVHSLQKNKRIRCGPIILSNISGTSVANTHFSSRAWQRIHPAEFFSSEITFLIYFLFYVFSTG